eukprot:7381929-Prymnesium_polylepis.3
MGFRARCARDDRVGPVGEDDRPLGRSGLQQLQRASDTRELPLELPPSASARDDERHAVQRGGETQRPRSIGNVRQVGQQHRIVPERATTAALEPR